jgi:hypothetical protein
MYRLLAAIVAGLAVSATVQTSQAQAPALPAEQRAIELVAARYLATTQRSLLEGMKVGRNWVLEPRLTVMAFHRNTPSGVELRPIISPAFVVTASHDSAQLEKLVDIFGLDGVLDDSTSCTTPTPCRYNSVMNYISISAALIRGDSAEFGLGLNQKFTRTLRDGTTVPMTGGSFWTFTLVKSDSTWSVVRSRFVHF